MQPSMDQMKLQVGLATQDSSDPLTALKGKEMVSEAVNGSNTSQIIPSAQGNTTSFSDKFSNSTFGKNFGAWSVGLDIANTAFTGLFGEKGEYSGEKGDVTRTIDSTYDSIQNLAGSFGPIGQVVSLGMGANKLLGNVANKLGAGTSGMTTTDAILGSSFLQLTPIGLINGFGGKKADTITKDQQAFEVVGSSYTGSNQRVNDALQKSGKKYGLLSSGSRRKANREIAEAKRQQAIISDIAEDSTNRFNIRNSMAAINGNNYALQLQGGYDQKAVRVGRRGLKVESVAKDGGTFIEISTETSIELVDPISIPEFQNGGSINVIPNGALHARKHNMDLDGITRKGIPVVSEREGEIEQQAEIEKEEIIFRLEVTQKLEELEKKFYSDESTQEEKDECALEAGKLLVNEILYNTQDNTNNLL